MYENELKQFEENGFVNLKEILKNEIEGYQEFLKIESEKFLNEKISSPEQIHASLKLEQINNYRLHLIDRINKDSSWKNDILKKLTPFLTSCLGADLVTQRSINLVVSPPDDGASQIPFHSDVWTGHSPFELNLWIPLFDSSEESSMYIYPLQNWRSLKSDINFKNKTINEILSSTSEKREYVSAKAGDVFVFWHHLPHGNHKHHQERTRFTLNLRVKNLFSPYGEKGLGDYFVPYLVSPLTKIVLDEGSFIQ